jgi:hypothetical protein
VSDMIDLDRWIDTRLEAMAKRPLMYASLDGLEGIGHHLISIWAEFVLRIDFNTNWLDNFQDFRRTLYPRCPGPMMFAQWFTDSENGCGTGDTEVDEREGAKKIVEFFIAWKAELQKQSEQK